MPDDRWAPADWTEALLFLWLTMYGFVLQYVLQTVKEIRTLKIVDSRAARLLVHLRFHTDHSDLHFALHSFGFYRKRLTYFPHSYTLIWSSLRVCFLLKDTSTSGQKGQGINPTQLLASSLHHLSYSVPYSPLPSFNHLGTLFVQEGGPSEGGDTRLFTFPTAGAELWRWWNTQFLVFSIWEFWYRYKTPT